MKIKCVNPKHTDETPSMEVYENGMYCFACGFRAPLDGVTHVVHQEPTDISKELEYIDTLPLTRIRGFYLHADTEGYYLIWPNKIYYKKRLFNSNIRYIGPRGHKPPIFKLGSGQNAIVVEGEINALSLHEILIKNHVILSPGSATELPKMLLHLLTFNSIVIIVDKDIPGVGYGTELKSQLLKHQKKVQLVAAEKDLNQILQEEGPEGVKTWFKTHVVLPQGMQIE